LMLTDIDTNKVFYDKLFFIYLEMPKFNKGIDDLETKFDKWLYVLKNLHKLDRIPDKLRESIFTQLFETAEIAKFSQDEYRTYENSLKYYRDLKNSLDTSREEGRKEGERIKQIEIAKNMLDNGLDISLICEITGLSEEEISIVSKILIIDLPAPVMLFYNGQQ